MRLFVLYNPVSGNSQTEDIPACLTALCGDQHTFELYETQEDDVLADVVKTAVSQQYDLIAAAGGDGTVSAVANGLVGSDTPLGIIPSGTGNLIARELHIPLNIEEACQLFFEPHQLTAIDGMQIKDHFYFSHISLGTYSRIIEETTPEKKQRFGRYAYIRSALREVRSHPRWRFAITVDGKPSTYRASMIMAANIGEVGLPPLRWKEDTHPGDGRIDLCIVRAFTLLGYLRLLWRMRQTNQPAQQEMVYLTAQKSVTIQTNPTVPVRADGEIIGKGHVHLTICPHLVRVIKPLSNHGS